MEDIGQPARMAGHGLTCKPVTLRQTDLVFPSQTLLLVHYLAE